MVNTLTQSMSSMQRHYNENTGKRNLLLEQWAELQRKLDVVVSLILLREQAILLLTKTAEVARGALVQFIEEAVTPPLQAIWGDDRYFKVRQYVHNSKTQEAGADFEVWKPAGGGVFVPVHPYNASGGGLGDVVSAVLQMTLLEISKPKFKIEFNELTKDNKELHARIERCGGPLCLDEPSKQLDNVKDESGSEDDAGSLAQKQEALAEFIRAYAESSGRQVLLSSHNATLIRKAHRIVKIELINAVTCQTVEEVTGFK